MTGLMDKIDLTWRGGDHQPPQAHFTVKSKEYMEAFRAFVQAESGTQAQREALAAMRTSQNAGISKVPRCRCGAILHDGKCWYGCTSPAALAAQRAADADIIALYNKVEAGYPDDETFDDEQTSGNYRAEETDYYAHPD